METKNLLARVKPLTAAARKAVVFPAPWGPAKIMAPPPLFTPCNAETPEELFWRYRRQQQEHKAESQRANPEGARSIRKHCEKRVS